VTKRHFIMLAEWMRDQRHGYRSNAAHVAAACVLADTLALDHPRFDRARFITACMPRVYVGSRLSNPWERAIARVELAGAPR